MKAQAYFHNTYINTSKILVEFALPPGSEALNKGKKKKKAEAPKKRQSTEHKSKANKKLDEFLQLMAPRSKAQFWGNDEGKQAPKEESSDEDSESDSDEDLFLKKDDEIKKKEAKKKQLAPAVDHIEEVGESGRLFVRNLTYECDESQLRALFEPFGVVSEVHLPLDLHKKPKGFGYVLFLLPADAVQALTQLDSSVFQGRTLHVLPAMSKRDRVADQDSSLKKDYKSKKDQERVENAGSEADQKSWNALFIRGDMAVGAMAAKLGMSKADLILEDGNQGSAAVRMALSEAKVIAENKAVLMEEGVDLVKLEACFKAAKRSFFSEAVLLVKNLPPQALKEDLEQRFGFFGKLERVVLTPSNTLALVVFEEAKDAQKVGFEGVVLVVCLYL